MRILQVNAADAGGGAERVATALHGSFRRLGHEAVLAVGQKDTTIGGVEELDHDRRRRGARRVTSRFADAVGLQYVQLPESRQLPSFAGGAWDVVVLHNLHGGYFDPAAIRDVAAAVPTILVMHDMWLLTGHCAHPLGCGRWQDSCGRCPHKDTYPAVRLDTTRWNLARKRRALRGSPCAVSSPARWLVDLASEHLGVTGGARWVPNPVDATTFTPAPAPQARRELGLPVDRPVLLFPARVESGNPFKDLDTIASLRRSLADIDPVLLTLGGGAVSTSEGHLALPATKDPAQMARYYAAADVVVYASHAETSPIALLEAAACERPVVATAVGGIGEIIRDQETGLLVAPGHEGAFGAAVRALLDDPSRAKKMGLDARALVVEQHDLDVVTARWLAWFHDLRGTSGA
jgi:glycosyltransferase involved in cell wall biosynthesis